VSGRLLFTLAIASIPSVARAQERQFIDSFVAVPSSVLGVVAEVLPESRAVGTSFLSSAYDPNLVFTAPANVTLTFVHEGAGYRNALGYFTYTTDGATISILDRQLVFPNASFADPKKGWGGGTLVSGDTVTLRDASGAIRTFQPGERVGLFLVADGWSGSSVKGWNGINPSLPSTSASSNASNRVFTTLDSLNPEVSTGFHDKARHVAILRIGGQAGFFEGDDFFLVGFEDLRRDQGADEDFNDVVVIAHANPIEAVSETVVPLFLPGDPDPDQDGVSGLSDYFPEDPDRAFIVRTPATGWQTLAYEDRYPLVGDADFNDAVFQISHEEVLDADGNLKALIGTYHLFARGAALDHAFGVAVHGLPPWATGSIEIERFAPTMTRSTIESRSLENALEVGQGLESTLALEDLVASTTSALSPNGQGYTNTVSPVLQGGPASVRFVVTFDAPIARGPLGAAPFDPFLSVLREGGERWDIHLPNRPPRPGRPSGLPDESGPNTFLDPDGYPFALLLPNAWRFPLERVPIETAYPTFVNWRNTRGSTSQTWYSSPTSTSPSTRVTNVMLETLRTRGWSLKASAVRRTPGCSTDLCTEGRACSAETCPKSVLQTCIDAVCTKDPYCCDSGWDALCVAAVIPTCGQCP
jgi:LruC domain-containing protein